MFERLGRLFGFSASDQNQKPKSTTTQRPVERATARSAPPSNGGSDDSVIPAYVLYSTFNSNDGNNAKPVSASVIGFNDVKPGGGGGGFVGNDDGGGGGGGDGGEITCDPNRDVILLRQRAFRL